MTKIIVNEAVIETLGTIDEPVEICDGAGRTVGYFTPVTDSSLYENVHVPFTEEELDRFENEPGGYSLSEILKDLKDRS